jgi:hypothetical protein
MPYDSIDTQDDDEAFNQIDDFEQSAPRRGYKTGVMTLSEDKYGDSILSMYRLVESNGFAPMKMGVIVAAPLTVLLFSLFISNSTATLIAFSAFVCACSFIVFSLWLLGWILD